MEDDKVEIMKDVEEEEEEGEEEALSLCDLPLNRNSRTPSFDDASFNKSPTLHHEIFNGFSSSSSSDMCPADDIIFCGKLVPFKAAAFVQEAKPPPRRRRSESLSAVTRSNSASTCTSGCSRRLMMRNSKSLDYSRISAAEVERNSSAREAKKATKPRWYSLMFGTMKVPPEMELSDMKNRQVRRTTMLAATAEGGGGKAGANRKVSWRILKALSCKDHSSVAVTTSFALPQAS